MRSFFIGLIILLIFVACGGTLYYLYSKGLKEPVVYETKSPEFLDIIRKAVATGSVIPRKEIEIKPQVSGLVEKLYVEAGDVVKKGTLIATVKIIPDMVNLNNAENRLNRAKIDLDRAKKDFNRNEPLYKDGVISSAAFQEFEVGLKNAEEELAAAKDNLELIREGSTAKYAKSGNTNVRAAIAGMILDVPVEEGNSVIEANNFNDGTTIVTLADMDEIIFEGKVDESEVGKLREGMDLILTIGALEDQEFLATLEHISPKGVEENGAIQFAIRAALTQDPDQFIRANYSANADIVLEKRDSVLSLQESLLIFEGDSTFVEMAVGEQKFEKRYVKTGLSDGINIEILNGLSIDDLIKDPNSINK